MRRGDSLLTIAFGQRYAVQADPGLDAPLVGTAAVRENVPEEPVGGGKIVRQPAQAAETERGGSVAGVAGEGGGPPRAHHASAVVAHRPLGGLDDLAGGVLGLSGRLSRGCGDGEDEEQQNGGDGKPHGSLHDVFVTLSEAKRA